MGSKSLTYQVARTVCLWKLQPDFHVSRLGPLAGVREGSPAGSDNETTQMN